MSDFGVPLELDFNRTEVSDQRAESLVTGGEWTFAQPLLDEIAVAWEGFAARLPIPTREPPADFGRARDLWSGVRAMLREYEHLDLRSPPPTPLPQMRLAPGFIVKVGPTLRAVIPKAIAFALYIVGASQVNGVFFGGVALHGYEIMKVLKSSWERIEDPDERQVFEAIAELSARLTIVDYEAYDREQLLVAYGQCAPTIDALHAHLVSRLDKRTIEKALVTLKRREIVSATDGRWRLVF